MSYSTTVLADSPLAYWQLDETTGATQFADSTGNSHPATISGTPTYSTSYKVEVGSVGFSGTQYGSVTSGAWFGSLSAYSVEAWFSTTTSGNRSIVSYDNSATGPGSPSRVFQFYVSNGAVVFLPMASGSFVVVTSPLTNYTDGIWHHAVATWDGTTARLYVDGSQVASAALSGTMPTGGGQPILIGTGYNNAPGNFYQYIGSIDEVAVYGSALNSTQISAHYAAGIANLPSQTRVETAYVESLATGTPTAQVEASFVESLATGTPAAQVETVFIEALAAVQPAQVEAVYTESLLNTTPASQAEAVYAESLLQTSSPPAQIETIYTEILLLPTAGPGSFVGWGVPI